MKQQLNLSDNDCTLIYTHLLELSIDRINKILMLDQLLRSKSYLFEELQSKLQCFRY